MPPVRSLATDRDIRYLLSTKPAFRLRSRPWSLVDVLQVGCQSSPLVNGALRIQLQRHVRAADDVHNLARSN